jgi:dienelactone hydrolase
VIVGLARPLSIRLAKVIGRSSVLGYPISRLPKFRTLTLCALIIVVAITRAASAPIEDVQACGPFGNPPARLIGTVKPDCGIGDLLGPWKDGDGMDRYACLYKSKSAGAHIKLPLLVYLHPSQFQAKTITRTDLLDFQDSYVLSGDPKRPGFTVLAPQGRKNVHHYPVTDRIGSGWDNWYRQLNPAGDVKVGDAAYPENADAAAIDHFIAQQVATGEVDSDRIYVTGWSNGAAMASLYALNRPGVAAVAVYSAPDPFGAFDDPCAQKPVAAAPASIAEIRILNSRVPTMHLHNACDVAGICPNGEKLAADLRAVGVKVRDVIIDASGRRVSTCIAYCGANPAGDLSILHHPLGYYLGLRHHDRWPAEWNRYLLDFLRRNSLNVSGVKTPTSGVRMSHNHRK